VGLHEEEGLDMSYYETDQVIYAMESMVEKLLDIAEEADELGMESVAMDANILADDVREFKSIVERYGE
jgi:hypothetical protein